MIGLVAFAVDIGFITLTRTQLQVAADAAAMVSALIQTYYQPFFVLYPR